MLVGEIYDMVEKAEGARLKMVSAQNSNNSLPPDVDEAMHAARSCLAEYIALLSDLKSTASNIRIDIIVQPDV